MRNYDIFGEISDATRQLPDLRFKFSVSSILNTLVHVYVCPFVTTVAQKKTDINASTDCSLFA